MAPQVLGWSDIVKLLSGKGNARAIQLVAKFMVYISAPMLGTLLCVMPDVGFINFLSPLYIVPPDEFNKSSV